MAEVKTDCILYDAESSRGCKGLNRLYCAEDDQCAFYKTVEQEAAQELMRTMRTKESQISI